MKPLLIIKTGTTVSGLAERRGDFETWISQGMSTPGLEFMVAPVYLDAPLPEVTEVSGVIITGSPAMVTDRAAWSERAALWLRHAVATGIPVLGICYGHQLLAHALGGQVDFHPKGREIGTVEIYLTESAANDPLLAQGSTCFTGHVSHSQTVTALPAGAVVLATNGFEPHHAVRYTDHCWGLQYHPEFDEDIMAAYIEARRAALEEEGLDPDSLLAAIKPAARAAEVLRRFRDLLPSS